MAVAAKNPTANIERDMDPELKEAVWAVLLEHGAHESDHNSFLHSWPKCREFRFMGHFGFGGKIWCNNDRIYVSCYSENQSQTIKEEIAGVNDRLAGLREDFIVRHYPQCLTYTCQEDDCHFGSGRTFQVPKANASLFGITCPHGHYGTEVKT